MIGSDPVARARTALDAVSASSAMASLDAARRLRETAEEIEQAAAADARWSGATWTEIGAMYGTSKQGAQQRFGKKLPKRPATPGRAQPRSSGTAAEAGLSVGDPSAPDALSAADTGRSSPDRSTRD